MFPWHRSRRQRQKLSAVLPLSTQTRWKRGKDRGRREGGSTKGLTPCADSISPEVRLVLVRLPGQTGRVRAMDHRELNKT